MYGKQQKQHKILTSEKLMVFWNIECNILHQPNKYLIHEWITSAQNHEDFYLITDNPHLHTYLASNEPKIPKSIKINATEASVMEPDMANQPNTLKQTGRRGPNHRGSLQRILPPKIWTTYTLK